MCMFVIVSGSSSSSSIVVIIIVVIIVKVACVVIVGISTSLIIRLIDLRRRHAGRQAQGPGRRPQ